MLTFVGAVVADGRGVRVGDRPTTSPALRTMDAISEQAIRMTSNPKHPESALPRIVLRWRISLCQARSAHRRAAQRRSAPQESAETIVDLVGFDMADLPACCRSMHITPGHMQGLWGLEHTEQKIH
jgi:hypothetical protein